MLKEILKKCCMSVWAVFNRFRNGSSYWLLWRRQWTINFFKIWEIFGIAERLYSGQEGVFSMKFLYFIVGLFSEQSMCLCHCWFIQLTVYVPLSLLVYSVNSLCASVIVGLFSGQSVCLCHCWFIQWTVYVPLSLLVYSVDSLCASVIVGLFSGQSMCLFHYKPISEYSFTQPVYRWGPVTSRFARWGNGARRGKKKSCFLRSLLHTLNTSQVTSIQSPTVTKFLTKVSLLSCPRARKLNRLVSLHRPGQLMCSGIW